MKKKYKDMTTIEKCEYANKRATFSDRLSTVALVVSAIALAFKIFCLFI